MTRSIASATQTKLAGRQIFVADLIELQLSTPQYLTTSNIDIPYDSTTAPDAGTNTYLAQGQFLDYGNIVESADLRISSIDMEFTAVDTTTIALLMSNDYIDKRVVIYRAVLDEDYSFTSDDIWLMFDGTVTAYTIKETENTATVTITIASQFADFLRKNGRRTNPASQNIHFSSDKGMDFSPQIVKDIKWGKA
tara:strand:- start:291 stop:872 length:582 start_codon:yes stop_codon:yes gene_type:complete